MMSGNRGGSNGRLVGLLGLLTWERMLSLDSDGVRGELVRVMSDGQTGDWRLETGDLQTEVMLVSWCGPVATK